MICGAEDAALGGERRAADVNRENRRLLFWTFNFFLTGFDKEKLA